MCASICRYVVMSGSTKKLQELLKVVNKYGRELGVTVSSEKSQIMAVNGADNESNSTWRHRP